MRVLVEPDSTAVEADDALKAGANNRQHGKRRASIGFCIFGEVWGVQDLNIFL